MSDIAEILLAQIWNSQWFHQPLRTVDGSEVRVIYPGVWTHGFGPDFSGSMLAIDGRIQTGDIEIDLTVAGWHQHGHDENPAFDSVVLHVIARDDGSDPVRTSAGRALPRVALLDHLRGELEDFPEAAGVRPLGAIGFDTCAPGPAVERPDLIEEICQRAGDRRMQERVSTLSGELNCHSPAQVLYGRLLDALGFSSNREPMSEVAARLPFHQVVGLLANQSTSDRFWRAAAVLLGVGGFLPLSPRDASMADLEPQQVSRIEELWDELGKPWHQLTVSPNFWSLSRARPASHPVRRLLAMAFLLGKSGDALVESILDRVVQAKATPAVRRWLVDDNPYLGNDHGHEIVVNVVVPFAIAYGEEANQPDIADAAAELWQSLPAGRGNALTRRTLRQICGETEVRPTSARAEQGLIHINRHGCSQMRCFECPVAHLALEWEGRTE